jgi:hypothetical protein
LAISVAAQAASEDALDPSKARRIFVGKMLIAVRFLLPFSSAFRKSDID